MGRFRIDGTSKPGIIIFQLEGALSPQEMREYVAACKRTIEALHGAQFRSFVDIRVMLPLSPESTSILQEVKEHAAAQPNFQGSAVLVASSLIAMQHRRTSIASGVMETELISDDEAACWEHLRRVRRHPP